MKTCKQARALLQSTPQAPAVPELDPMTRLIVSDPKQIKPKKQEPAVPYGIDEEAANRIALAVYDCKNGIKVEPLLHAINHILMKEIHPLSQEGLAQMQPIHQPVGNPDTLTPHKGATHCDDCGLTWLDDGLNPLGCPYCKDTIPAPAVPEEWRKVMAELADDLAIEIDQNYPPESRVYPSEQRRYKGEMEIVNLARALLQSAPQSEVRHD